MQISIIKKSDIQDARRFDAEFFKLEYLENDKIVNSGDYDICNNLVKREITKGETPLWQGFNYIKKGIPFVRSQNFKSFGINKNELVFVSEEYNHLKKRSIIKNGDTLLAIVGATIGEIGFYDLSEDGNCNQAVAIISPKNNLSKEFFNILFRTKFIQLQIERTQGGNARDNFDLFEVRNLKIPILPQSFQLQIEKIVKSAYEKQTRSKQLYKKAEEALLKEVDLLDYKPEHILSYETTKKETDEAGRFDAEYFQPKYEEIIKKIEKYKVLNLSDEKYFKIITGTYTKKYSKKGSFYIRSVNINEDLTMSSDNLYKTQEKLDSKFIVKTGDIITSRVGSIGTLGFISEEFNQKEFSVALLRGSAWYNK